MEEQHYGHDQPVALPWQSSIGQTTALLDPATIIHVLSQGPGPGCYSEAILKTPKALETHVFNLHANPLRCTWNGCKNTTPFGKQGDLERQISSMHLKDNRYKYPVTSCSRHQRGFPRKDKLQSHMRQPGHVLTYCSYTYHNEGFLTREEFLNHQGRSRKAHGNYKCAIGDCRGSSYFSALGLKDHVRDCHGFTPGLELFGSGRGRACYRRPLRNAWLEMWPWW